MGESILNRVHQTKLHMIHIESVSGIALSEGRTNNINLGLRHTLHICYSDLCRFTTIL